MTLLGNNASKQNGSTLTNGTAIGYNAKVLQSNQVVLGNDNVTTTLLKGSVGIGTTSPDSLLSVNGSIRGTNIKASGNLTAGGSVNVGGNVKIGVVPNSTSDTVFADSAGYIKKRLLPYHGHAYVNNQSGSTYTLQLSDAENDVVMSNTNPIVTIPPNSGGGGVAFPIGTRIKIIWTGNTNSCSVVGGSGVIINSSTGTGLCNKQYGIIYLDKLATNTWIISGDLELP